MVEDEVNVVSFIKKGLTEKQVYEKSKSFQQDYKLITNYRKVKKPRKKIY